MTQEVQPLTWSKRTNIEEHQQFFSKINEIIGNLAPTVDEAEQAIAQATAAIASANDAVATANAASAAASAAASQAQTAASTVAGYDGRLTAAEGGIDALQAADQTMTGNISALGTRMTAAESKNSQQDASIAALQTADAQNVKISRINEYALGLTGNQVSAGVKGFRTYTMKINPAFKRDVPAENYKYLVLESLATDIGEPATAQTYFALGGGSAAYIAQKSIGWDLHGKSSDNKDWEGRFGFMLDPDNGRLSLIMRVQNLTDGTSKSMTVATLSMV